LTVRLSRDSKGKGVPVGGAVSDCVGERFEKIFGGRGLLIMVKKRTRTAGNEEVARGLGGR